MMAEKLNRLDEMERLLRKVIELKPDHHHAYNALGYSLAERNLRLPEARQLIQKALELSPGEPFITDSLGWVEYRLGNRDEALRLLRRPTSRGPTPRSPRTSARCCGSAASATRPAASGARRATATAPTTCCARRWPGCGWICDASRGRAGAAAGCGAAGGLRVGAHRRRAPPPGETLAGRLAVRVDASGDAERARSMTPPSSCRARPRPAG